MKKLLFLITSIMLFSCENSGEFQVDKFNYCDDTLNNVIHNDTEGEHKQSNYDMSLVDDKHSQEFMESLVEIEKKYGEQWDFCTCVIKNDSINKAFSQPVSDAEFEKLSARFDVIDEKCKAFLVQNPNVTPEERAEHERKVKKCLKEAGIK